MAVAPLHVLVVYGVEENGEETYEVNVGLYGRKYDLRFRELLNLIRHRCGWEQKRLEYRK